MDALRIFDTTLRDGEQAPGFSMTTAKKLKMARELEALGVDTIEAGFPAASDGDFKSVQRVASEIESSTICGLARCHEADIETAGKALSAARRSRLHVFIATSPIHREFKLRLDTDEIIERAVSAVHQAVTLTDEVEFSAEDACRTEPEFLAEIFTAVIEAGAGTINVPDTVGYTTPEEMGRLISYLNQHVPNIASAVISVHCHNDLGMAVANSLAAVRAGARQVECTVNGIGERAGNAALEEVVMAVRTRQAFFDCDTRIDSKQLYRASRTLSAITGSFVPPNKAIVGDNAFAHEAGIHQHGMMAHASTYEIMKPDDVGIPKSRLVLGKHSGRHALGKRLDEIGIKLEPGDGDRVFEAFKHLADVKSYVFDSDLEAICSNDPTKASPWSLGSLRVETGTSSHHSPTAVVALQHRDGYLAHEAAVGDGPLDAAFKAIQRVTGIDLKVMGLNLRSISEGEDAQGHTTVRADCAGEHLVGHGVGTDIIVAATQAFLEIINNIARRAGYQAPNQTRLAVNQSS